MSSSIGMISNPINMGKCHIDGNQSPPTRNGPEWPHPHPHEPDHPSQTQHEHGKETLKHGGGATIRNKKESALNQHEPTKQWDKGVKPIMKTLAKDESSSIGKA